MSADTSADDGGYVTLGVDAREMDRYGEVTVENGEVMIYDRENEDAWFQSDSAIQLALMA